jgi:hypothetical protein
MLPSLWKPVDNVALLRLGSESDGGYWLTLASLAATKTLLSFGLSSNWDFEEDFRHRSGAKVICFDHTVNAFFWRKHAVSMMSKMRFGELSRYFSYKRFFNASSDVEHRLVQVGYDGPGSTSLATLMRDVAPRSLFLKSDIEGSEYRIFNDILAYQERLTGIAIEFHDIDLHRERVSKLLEGLKDFVIVALAANNFGGVDSNGDPIVIEMSLIHRDFVEPRTETSPYVIPVANNPHQAALLPVFAD